MSAKYRERRQAASRQRHSRGVGGPAPRATRKRQAAGRSLKAPCDFKVFPSTSFYDYPIEMAVRVFVFVFLFVGTCEAGTLLARSNGHGAARQQEHRSYEGSLAQQLASWTHPLQRCFTDIQPGFSNCLQSGTSASIRTVLAKFLGSVKNKYTASTRREVNVLVIGGGPGGFFAGLELLKRGFAVAVVEKYAHFTRARAVGLFTHQIKWFEDLGMEQATELPFGVPKEGSTVPEIQYVQRAAFLAAGGTLYMGCTVAQVTEDNQVSKRGCFLLTLTRCCRSKSLPIRGTPALS